MRKQANSKAIKKHLRSNGMNSFDFHPSTRMVPHVFQPDVRLVEISIEQFVPRGKKVRDDNPVPVPAYKTSLTDAETDLLAKYFSSTGETAWRPSLIAFPHFQAFPSPVNKVIHSSRTGILIDMMQSLQGLTFSNDDKIISAEGEEDTPNNCLKGEVMKPRGEVIEDRSNDPAGETLNTEIMETPVEVEEIDEEVQTEDFHKQGPCLHNLLFDSEFVSVDDVGNVLILSLPKLPLESNSHVESDIVPPLHLIDGSEDNQENRLQANNCPSQLRSPQFEKLLGSSTCSPVTQKWKQSEADEILCTPVSKRIPEEMDIFSEDHNFVHDTTEISLPDESSNDLSPRLTNFIKSGIVPESPVNDSGTSNGDRGNSAFFSSPNLQRVSTHSWKHNEKAVQDGTLSEMDAPCLTYNKFRSPIPCWKESASAACAQPVAIADEVKTPLAKSTETNSSKDLLFDSGVKPETVEQQCKFKRLRKHGDLNRKPEPKEQTSPQRKRRTSGGTGCDTTRRLVEGDKKQAKNIAVYIEEEAEVSSEVVASDDEEDGEEGSSYEDSFIDDGVNATSAATPAGDSGTDMMAIYRRSLLSQSPFQRLPNFGNNFSRISVVQSSRIDEDSRSPSETQHNHTPQTGLASTARNSQLAIPTATGESKLESRKRKLRYYQVQSVPAVNLNQTFSLLHEAPGRNSTVEVHAEREEENRDVFEDDDFYQGIDLDAVEEEAARLLRYKSECSTQKTATEPEPPIQQDVGFMGSPSFDLGI